MVIPTLTHLHQLSAFHRLQTLANLRYLYPTYTNLDIISQSGTLYIVSGARLLHRRSYPRLFGGSEAALWRMYRWSCKQIADRVETAEAEGLEGLEMGKGEMRRVRKARARRERREAREERRQARDEGRVGKKRRGVAWVHGPADGSETRKAVGK